MDLEFRTFCSSSVIAAFPLTLDIILSNKRHFSPHVGIIISSKIPPLNVSMVKRFLHHRRWLCFVSGLASKDSRKRKVQFRGEPREPLIAQDKAQPLAADTEKTADA